MAAIWGQVAFVFALAMLATTLALRYRLPTALAEIIIGMVAGSVLAAFGYYNLFAAQEPWVKTLAGMAAVMLTFLAGAELDPDVFQLKWREALAIGLASFLFPAIGCWAAARFLLGWDNASGLLAGIALAATSVAVVYTVMMEYGLNQVEYGKTLLAACFITDLGTVITLGTRVCAFYLEDPSLCACIGGRLRRPSQGHSTRMGNVRRKALGV